MSYIISFFGRKVKVPFSLDPLYEKNKVQRLIQLRDYALFVQKEHGLSPQEILELFVEECYHLVGIHEVPPIGMASEYERNRWFELKNGGWYYNVGGDVTITVEQEQVIVKNYLYKGSVQVFNCD